MHLRPLALALLLTAWISPAARAEEKRDARFTATQVTEGVWRIDDAGADNAYLVAGTEKALLVDTGEGKGDLAKLVRTLTRLPLTVVVTHGHPDHAGGVSQFAEVHVHPDDLEAAWPLHVPEG